MFGRRSKYDEQLEMAHHNLTKFLSIVYKPRLILNEETKEVHFENVVPDECQDDVDTMMVYIKHLRDLQKVEIEKYMRDSQNIHNKENKCK